MPDRLTRTDDELMRDAADRNPAAFAGLFERHGRPLHGYLRKLTGNAEAASDLTQEAFLIAFRARFDYRPRGLFAGWLYRIATNLARERIQQSGREGRVMQELVREKSAEGAPAAGPAQSAEASENRLLVERALARLSIEEREVIVLRHFQGMKFREIASALRENESTVKSRMRYGLEKLALYLKPVM
jgi:RNA polymerase sigma-70 factor (ECF subfamily)